mgnify:CR=1 FL=1
MTEIPKGDEYDTSAVDTHILEVAKRERSITQSFRIKNFGQMVLWGGLAGIIFALAFILISYGVRLMIYPPPEKEFLEQSIPAEITLKLDEPILVELNDETQDQRSMRNIENNFNSTQQNEIIKSFSKFQEQTVNGYKVTTGWRYFDSNARKPDSEWCYTESNSITGGITNMHYTIANKKNNSFTREPNANLLAQEMGIDISSAMQIINACIWDN